MPDPTRYAITLVITSLASVFAVLIARRGFAVRSHEVGRHGVGAVAELLIVSCCVVVGCQTLGLQLRWPPSNALSRLFLLLLPATLLVELVIAWSVPTRRMAWGLRWLIVLGAPIVLWWNSVYLRASVPGEWSRGDSVLWYAASVVGLGLLRSFTLELATRDGGSRVALVRGSVAASILTVGLLIAFAGYLQGGISMLPLVGAMSGPVGWRLSRHSAETSDGVLAWSVMALFGLAFVGRFFGALSTTAMVVVCCAPLAGWLSLLFGRVGEGRERRAPWWHVTLVAVPLLIQIAWGAWRFQQKLGSLV